MTGDSNADARSLAELRSRYDAGTLTVPELAAGVIAASSVPAHAEAWIHRVPDEELLAAARALQALPEARRKALALFGVPFAVKDNIDVAGVPTTAACPGFARIPVVSAPAVQRLLDAGALFVGKTNMDQFATGLVGVRSPYGACKNPFDARYITGGSSSGSALAVATGMVSFALGTDTAGSGRVPAAFCNLVGLKPTKGRVSTRGVVPACPSLDCVTVFATGAEDAFAVLRVLEGFDAADPWSRHIPLSAASSANLKAGGNFRFGVPLRGQLDFSGDVAYEALYGEAVERLQAHGGTATPVDIGPLLECARLLYSGPWLAERAEAIAGRGGFGEEHPEALLPLLRTILEPAKAITAMDTFRGFGALRSLIRVAESLWESIDFLLLPTAPTIFTQAEVAAEPLARNADLGRFTNFVNLMDLSALALPAGFRPDGLPFGVTLMAPAFREDVLEQAAAVWEGRGGAGAR
ncbi:MAG TPA: allophanate hydrolase, partial [Fibrobacteria bacterium]|nr:allophanate hydrolase [Fibrobacteria bacterium]